MTGSMNIYSSARAMTAAVASGEISARELMELHLARIGEVNPQVNAIVSLDAGRALEGAAAADEVPAAERGPLHGLPFAAKDTHATAGWRTTFGSTLYADHVPEHDELIVERIRGGGAVLLGKTNVPEFAAGSHTFNQVFGTTYNPWDLTRSAGGSSGGAGAALASGMVPLADGSDMGGSLRNPASFNGVVGLRPSLGRVPEWPLYNLWETTSTGGPMARSVDDLALLLSVIAGPDPRSPQALGTPGSVFAGPVRGSLAGVRVAVSETLGDLFALDDDVRAVVRRTAGLLVDAGVAIDEGHPDLTLADDTFVTLRAWHMQSRLGQTLAEHPGVLKASLEANIRRGEGLTGADVARAFAQRTTIAQLMRLFFERYDVLLLPVSQVAPFPADQEYPATVGGAVMPTYLDWMRSCYLITVTGCPAISVPAGYTPDGLPVGVQLVGPHGSELRLLEIAAGLEDLVGVAGDRPPV